MKIFQATCEHIDAIYRITQRVVLESYPHYYPAPAVKFMSDYHDKEKIGRDIREGTILMLETDDGIPAATGTARGCQIGRLFVLPEYQGRGMGASLMDELEQIVFQSCDRIRLDASLPAKPMYIKRGYKEIRYEIQSVGNGDFVCFSVMELKRPGDRCE
ncbi:MAG: GNAT family N-acetyltransferase [Bacillota bacterium]|jgi:GNAT superfamily N-acetyltransferase|nr:GNAT family N-acetyltransferase [Eubacteriales bacterium]MDI9491556.1 GNAT family N-acetyltransferase [Bacillota bacterium]NLV70054.1 GNAT family N-acetyltransferase [Clostridiales bacterium]HRV32798.1 GNAT family N-acetyltransferase [Anaerovoracaceae bacterium]MDD3537541.1 GNAT family N-acetyltransferase [Eubacteriales bacterium]